MFNSNGEKEWEFVNKDKNGDIGFISWSRVIEDEIFIEKFKEKVKNKMYRLVFISILFSCISSSSFAYLGPGIGGYNSCYH